MADSIDRTKSLEELDHDHWGKAGPTGLVRRCQELHRKPLNQLAVGDIRVLIGQRFCLEFLIPLAFEQLEFNPLVEGDLYPGDLLKVTFGAGETFWASHTEYCERLRKIIHRVQELLPTLDDIDRSSALQVLATAPQCLTDQ